MGITNKPYTQKGHAGLFEIEVIVGVIIYCFTAPTPALPDVVELPLTEPFLLLMLVEELADPLPVALIFLPFLLAAVLPFMLDEELTEPFPAE